jgi:DNA-binding GntR family transcriptional regulator
VLASSVLAATEKVVAQALEGAWSEVPRTLAARRELLNQLAAQAAPADQAWLAALQQAVAESEQALQAMAPPAAPAASSHDSAGTDALHLALRQGLLGK